MLALDNHIGFHPNMAPMRDMYNEGKVAILHGVGYANSPRSHFRSMDIWHTCEPDKLGTEGWLGRAVREIDPNKENVVTAVSMGPSLFRALAAPGVPVATVEDLDNYGMLTDISHEQKRNRVLERYKRMYAPAMGSGPVMDFLGQTGLDALKGADILKVAPQQYSSSIEYADTSIARKLKGISQVHTANLGTRVFYCDHGSFDTHADQMGSHATLWRDVSDAIGDFFDDLEEHDAADNVAMLIFSEFGRRVYDNGSRHRPRRGRRLVRHRQKRQGRPVWASIPPPGRATSSRATSSPTWTSAESTRRYSRTGSVWTPCPLWKGPSKSPRSSSSTRPPPTPICVGGGGACKQRREGSMLTRIVSNRVYDFSHVVGGRQLTGIRPGRPGRRRRRVPGHAQAQRRKPDEAHYRDEPR